MRLIDADALQYSDARDMLPTGQYITREEIDKAAEPTRHETGYEEDEVSKMLKGIDYWRKYCDLLERTIIKLAIRYMKRDEDNAEKRWKSVESVGGDR